MADKADIIVICGPTASGKTAVSVSLAKQIGGEIISADSMQIYKGLPIGTAQPSEEEKQGIPHHLMGFLPPEQKFSVADYVTLAAECIRDITARGKVPVITGGTGLYISSLINGISFTEEKSDPSIRQRLQKELEESGIEPLYEKLRQIDPEYAGKVHPNNHGRVLRALELFEQTGHTMSQQLQDSRPAERPYHALVIGLNTEERTELYARIDTRVDRMMEQGILAEAENVYLHRDTYHTAAQAIGYKEFFPCFEGKATAGECAEALRLASRHYAKRQLTWFRRMDDIIWLPAGKLSSAQQAACLWQKHRENK